VAGWRCGGWYCRSYSVPTDTSAMPGLHVTDTQVRLYMTKNATHHTQGRRGGECPAISERTARGIDRDPKLPSQGKPKRSWRTRPDPLIAVLASRARLCLQGPAGLMTVSIFETLQEEYGPDIMPDSVRRTLERRVSHWRALHGPDDKEVVLSPAPRAWAAGSCPTLHARRRTVLTLGGQAFAHRLYPLPAWPYSGWEHVRVVLGGESFSALCRGLQEALWKPRASPPNTGRIPLSAAFKTLDKDAQSSTSPAAMTSLVPAPTG